MPTVDDLEAIRRESQAVFNTGSSLGFTGVKNYSNTAAGRKKQANDQFAAAFANLPRFIASQTKAASNLALSKQELANKGALAAAKAAGNITLEAKKMELAQNEKEALRQLSWASKEMEKYYGGQEGTPGAELPGQVSPSDNPITRTLTGGYTNTSPVSSVMNKVLGSSGGSVFTNRQETPSNYVAVPQPWRPTNAPEGTTQRKSGRVSDITTEVFGRLLSPQFYRWFKSPEEYAYKGQ